MPFQKEFTIAPAGFSRRELWFAMGYADAEPDSNVSGIAEELIERLVPATILRYMYRTVRAEKISSAVISLDGKEFRPGGIICSYLDGMTSACVFVATAGKEFNEELQRIKSENDIVADFIADSIGSVLAELAVARLSEELKPEGIASLPYSPGYCGWDIKEQQEFFKLFPPEPCGIKLSESSLMYPEKSVSGFAAMGEKLVRQPYHCDICKNMNCYKRKNAR